MDSKKFFLAFLSVFIFTSISFAQSIDSTNIYRMSEVVITATKTKIPEIEAASSITVIDSTEIAEKGNSTVFGLLQNQYGVSYTQQGAPGSLSYVYLRGADPGETLILIDGVDVNMPNDPGNTFDFANLPTDNINKIEILRGPQSTLYGSNAMAGVINIITKQGFGAPKFFLSTEAGSYNTYKGFAGIYGGTDIFNYSATLSRLKTDGFSSASSKYGNTEKDGTSNYNFSSRFGFNLLENFDLNLFIRYSKANTGIDQHGGEFGDDPSYVYNTEESSYRAEGKLNLFDGLWDQTIGLSFFRNVREYSFDSTLNNPASSSSIYDGNKIKFDWQNNFNLSKINTLTFGIESETEKAISDYFYNSSSYGNFQSVFPNASSTTTGIYLQDLIILDNQLFTSAGLRYDHHDRFGSVLTYRIAPAFVIWETGTKIKATVGTGFKSPSLFYLFDPEYGNKDLKPEKSLGWDAGIEQYIINPNFNLGVNYFYNRFTDLFGFDNNFRTINIDKAETNGVEFYFKTNPFENLNISFNYTFTNSKNESVGSTDNGLPLLRIPKNKIGLNVNYFFISKADVNVELISVGERDDKDFNAYPAERVNLKNYTVANLAASYLLTNQIKIYGRVDNLFDTYYEEILGYATPGLSAYLGVKLTVQ
ncbi:MAG: TonB-dependent receptor [Bacteroidetes bacterium]|nr:TonB-dependent receptor [Bacteroidota bacterium]